MQQLLTDQLNVMHDAIKANEEEKLEMETAMNDLAIEREAVVTRLTATRLLASQQEIDTGPIQATFAENSEKIKTIYEKCKVSHAIGIKQLKEHFDYHPAYRKPGDEFHATPFVPK